MPSFTKKQQVGILIVGITLIFIASYIKGDSSKDDYYNDFEKISTEDMSKSSEEVDTNDEDGASLDEVTEVVVYIKGAVSKPGIVTAKSGKRVIDIVERAGGFLETADVESVNLARKVQDEEMIHIPHMGENIDSHGEPGLSNPPQARADLDKNSSNNDLGLKININTASKEELKTLSGVGDATAEKIISHRESSPFSKIEDIMDVSGIGDKRFEAIKDSIVVN